MIDMRCILCGKTDRLKPSEIKKQGWLLRYHDEVYDLTFCIMLCPEHNTPENDEKAVEIRRERHARIVAEDRLPDWYFEGFVDEE